MSFNIPVYPLHTNLHYYNLDNINQESPIPTHSLIEKILAQPTNKRNIFQRVFLSMHLEKFQYFKEQKLPIFYSISNQSEIGILEKGSTWMEYGEEITDVIWMLSGRALIVQGPIQNIHGNFREWKKKLGNMQFKFEVDKIFQHNYLSNVNEKVRSLFKNVRECWNAKDLREDVIFFVYILHVCKQANIIEYIQKRDCLFTQNLINESSICNHTVITLSDVSYAYINYQNLPSQVNDYFKLKTRIYYQTLNSIPQINQLNTRALKKIACFCKIQQFKKDWVIQKKNEVIQYLYFVLEGELQVRNNNKLIFEVIKHQSFGEDVLNEQISEYDYIGKCEGKLLLINLMSIYQLPRLNKDDLIHLNQILQDKILIKEQIKNQINYKLKDVSLSKIQNFFEQEKMNKLKQKYSKYKDLPQQKQLNYDEQKKFIEKKGQKFYYKKEYHGQLKYYGEMSNDYLNISRSLKQYAHFLQDEIMDIQTMQHKKLNLKYVQNKNETNFFSINQKYKNRNSISKDLPKIGRSFFERTKHRYEHVQQNLDFSLQDSDQRCFLTNYGSNSIHETQQSQKRQDQNPDVLKQYSTKKTRNMPTHISIQDYTQGTQSSLQQTVILENV